MRAVQQPATQLIRLLTHHELRVVAGQDGAVVLELDAGRQPAGLGEHVLDRGPVDGVVEWPAMSKSLARSGHALPGSEASCPSAEGGPGRDSRADTVRPWAASPYRRWNAGPSGAECLPSLATAA